MKIIDILVNIANHKEVPQKIKYNDAIYVYNSTDIQTDVILNSEVEIIEKERNTDIEQLDPFNYDEFKNMTSEERYKATIEEYCKINELVIALNKIKKENK